jgi:hypothetical protein
VEQCGLDLSGSGERKDVGSNIITNIKFQRRQVTSSAAKGLQLLMKV